MAAAAHAARAIAAGRVLAGVSLLAAPARAGRPWLGEDASRPATQAALRMLGARDLVLGLLTLHVAGREGVGYRTVATCAVVDAVDSAALLAKRDNLPSPGGPAVIGVAAGSALAGAGLAAAMRY